MKNKLMLIDNDAALVDICKQLQGCPWLAVDTEFERVNTYYPELCLVQVAGNDTLAVIDPLAIDDLEPLYALFDDPAIVKVFHSARQDFELFFHLRGKTPAPLFDTQVAAALRGYDQQTGYANLVREVLDIDLEKSETRTNWKQRPLSDKQLDYAADDVIYLGQLYELLRAKLDEADQLAQLDEQCQALANPALYEPDPQTMWRKIKNREVKKFDAGQREALQKLTAWRETTARQLNRPRKWILKDHTLVEMARDLPTNREALSRIDGLSEKLLKKHASVWLQLLHPLTDN